MRYVIVMLVVISAIAGFPDSLSMIFENDCLLRHADDDYTHGTGLQYQHDVWRFVLQQNMYTPSNLNATEHIPGARPYAGWLGAGIGRELLKDEDSAFTHYAELDFGMIGPSALAGETQRFIHKVLDCREPKGWDNQLHDEFCVNGQWWTKYNWFICDYVALVPRVGVFAGSLTDAVDGGCDLKVGWNIRKKKDVGSNQMFSIQEKKNSSFLDKLVVYGWFGGGCKYYLYNHFYEGSMFSSKDDDLKVDIKPFVGEMQCGVHLEYDGFYARWYGIFRTDEYKTQHTSPDYGGLVVGYKWNF